MINEILSMIVLVIIAFFIAIIIKYAIDSYMMEQESSKDQTYKIFNTNELQKRQNLKEIQQEQELIQENTIQNEEDCNDNQQKTIFSLNKISTPISNLNQSNQEQPNFDKNSKQEKQIVNKKSEKFLIEDIQIQTTQFRKPFENQIQNENYQLFIQSQEESKLVLNPIMPKLAKNQQDDVRNWILSLYNIHDNYNPDDVFISQILNQNQIEKELGVNNQRFSMKLRENLIGYRKVKQDPNSLFAALSFSFLENALKSPNLNQLENEMSWIKTMNLVIKSRSFLIDEKMFQNHQVYFLQKLLEIYQTEYPITQLELLMNDRQSQFYGLSIIYFRNLISLLLNNQAPSEHQEAEEILYWESDLSDANKIFELLADRLRIQIHEYSINKLKGQVEIKIYGQDDDRQIHLLCSDEHYDIGIGMND
ncbi:unnamed protein product (macronuclear) [Paramecium tetraurelia]|uniref:ubiquitinyl hydrolase 1 n=1 Tax=Paramecium tetraurelia TaxID=5888 RepID=A0BZM7_PARTE|nr:uncharacterized protein GSPATT00005846001 [Paramecium tetraurelia]CAK63994.1 unnamed protein product [Paramecium tetraurelia]|eukprot:XP_001431392.1 hypothetical protein (macronuclear) [Paramecium tetraurelia strain d4-2]